MKHHLDIVFSINDLGELGFFLGIEIGYLPEGISMTQKNFTKELLDASGLTHFKCAITPFPVNLKLHADKGELRIDPSYYMCLVGKLNFLTNTRPNLLYTVQTLSQFMQLPRTSHLSALHHALCYVANIAGQGFILKGTDTLRLQAFSDSNWAFCPDSRRSISGYVLLLGNSPISWKRKKQTIVSRSSSESEYRGMEGAAAEVPWMVNKVTLGNWCSRLEACYFTP